ncbi:MAG: glycosyltransferase family 39 protein [Candidatus Aenigmarchaeota archaeon]|nr:glycosyltransferase family 39 protein [Candidatus Aenigmarchaeota archaeon]
MNSKKTEFLLFAILIFACLFLLLTRLGTFIYDISDAYFHVSGGLFTYDIIKWWFENPSLNIEIIMNFIVNYQAQYKFLGGITYYPPLQSIFIAISAFLFGKNLHSVYIVTILESVATLYFAAKLYMCIYGNEKKNQYYAGLLIFFIFFNPIFLKYGSSASLDPGLMFFTTATLYYYISFLKTAKNKYLYLTSIFLALGINLKNPMFLIIPVLIIAPFIEKKTIIFKEKIKEIFNSVIIFLLLITPWLVSQFIFCYNGICRFFFMVSVATRDDGPLYSRSLMSFNESLFSIFGEYILILFFLYYLSFLFKKRKTGEALMVLFFLEILIFYNFSSHVDPRYFLCIVPIGILFSIRGIQKSINKYPDKKHILNILLVVMMFHSLFLSITYFHEHKEYELATDFMSAAKYINQNNQENVTVMSSFSRKQAVAFNLLNDKKVYVVHPPRDHAKEEDLSELKIMLNESFKCVQHPLKPEWEKFGLCHPPVKYIIIHERYDGFAMEYKLSEQIHNYPQFKLVETIEGKKPKNRIFIYKR